LLSQLLIWHRFGENQFQTYQDFINMNPFNSISRNIRILLPMLALLALSSCGYNDIVEKQEKVTGSWAQVQNVYQRRADLIPNLVNTVKGAANFEQKTLTDVMEARAKATQVTIKADDLTPEKVAKYQQAQQGLSSALSRLMVVSENYPNLKANQNFLDLQSQLEGTENRITVERMKFNESVQDYNTYIQKFPTNLTAKMFNFDKKGYFQAEASAQKAPPVQF
jgi:LemA protein